MRRRTILDHFDHDQTGLRGHAAILREGSSAARRNPRRARAMADGIAGVETATGQQRRVNLSFRVNGAGSVGIARRGGSGVIEQVVNIFDAGGPVGISEVGVPLIEPAIENRHHDVTSGDAVLGDRIVDACFHPDPVHRPNRHLEEEKGAEQQPDRPGKRSAGLSVGRAQAKEDSGLASKGRLYTPGEKIAAIAQRLS